MPDEEEALSSSSLQLPSTYEKTVSDALGVRKSCSVLSSVEWIFLLVSLLNILTCSALTIDRIIIYAQDRGSPDFTFALLLLISCFFSAFYVINGLFREHQYEIYAFIVAILLVMAYCILEYTFHTCCRTTVKLIRLSVSCVLGPPNIILALLVARRFGWLQFRIIGASNTLLQMYSQLKLHLSLQHLDLQASVSLLILCMDKGTDVNFGDELTLYLSATYAVIWFILGLIAVKKEIKSLVWIVGVFGLVMPVYVLYRIIEVYRDMPQLVAPNLNPDDIIKYSVLGVGALSLLVRFMLLAELESVYRNFGYGLQERAFTSLMNERSNLLGGARRAFTSSVAS